MNANDRLQRCRWFSQLIDDVEAIGITDPLAQMDAVGTRCGVDSARIVFAAGVVSVDWAWAEERSLRNRFVQITSASPMMSAPGRYQRCRDAFDAAFRSSLDELESGLRLWGGRDRLEDAPFEEPRR